MSQYIPYSGFKWLNQKEIDKFCLSSVEYSFIKENRSDGLHELHNGYPLALEKLSDKMLSNYCSNIADEYGITIGDVKRLVPNLGNKSKYVLHYRNLQLHISLGMKLVKVHKILKFKQSDWLKKIHWFKYRQKKKCS